MITKFGKKLILYILKQVRNIILSSEADGNVVVDQTNSTVTINVTISDEATIEYYLDDVKQESNTFAITPNKAHKVYIKILENDLFKEFTSNKLEVANGIIDLEFTEANVIVKGRIINVVGLPEGTLISFNGGTTWGTTTTHKVKSMRNTFYRVYVKREADSKYNELAQTYVEVPCWPFTLTGPAITNEFISYDAETKTITVNIPKVDFSEYGVELDDYEIEYKFKPNNEDWPEEWTTSNTFTFTDDTMSSVGIEYRYAPTSANEGQFSGSYTNSFYYDI